MSRTTKTLGFPVPLIVVKEYETIAKQERRTKSELFGEMVRVYQRFREQREPNALGWVAKLIEEAQAEQADNPMTVNEIAAESEEFARAGAKRAKELGIETDLKSATKLIDEYRKTQREHQKARGPA